MPRDIEVIILDMEEAIRQRAPQSREDELTKELELAATAAGLSEEDVFNQYIQPMIDRAIVNLQESRKIFEQYKAEREAERLEKNCNASSKLFH